MVGVCCAAGWAGGCGGAAQPQIETAPAAHTAVEVEAEAVPAELPPFVAYVPEGFTDSLIYADFAAIRAQGELAPTVEVFTQYLAENRPDVSDFFATEGLGLIEDARTTVLASPVGTWSWVMTTDYERPERLRAALQSAAPTEPQAIGAFLASQVEGEQAAPWVAQVAAHRVVLGTADGMEAASTVEPVALDFVRDDALVAWRVRGTRMFRRLPVRPTEVTASLFVVSGEPEDRPIVIEASAVCTNVTDAMSLMAYVEQAVADATQANPFIDMFFRRHPVSLSINGSLMSARIRFSAQTAQMLTTIVLSGLSGPPS